MIEAKLAESAPTKGDHAPRRFALNDFREMDHDTMSLRALTCLPPLLTTCGLIPPV